MLAHELHKNLTFEFTIVLISNILLVYVYPITQSTL
jgi:hypothetical protein